MFRLRSIILLLLVLSVASPVLAQPAAPLGSPALRQAAAPLVSLGTSKDYGKFLVGKDGMTLYSYTPDPLNETVCYDQCAKNWPPLLVESADKITVAEGIPGEFGTTKRKDNTLQVTYNGIALYYWIKDTKAGDTTGHRVGRVWWVVPPATVYAQRLPKLGSVLVGPKGMTLYLFTKDTPDVSTCYDQCATNWPPLLVKSADEIVSGVNLPGKWGTTKRKDDTLQVTYNGWPLYYWKDDKARGDATGEGVGKVWYTIVQETVGVKNSKDLGDILTSADGMTLYTFSKDTAGASTCTGDCAAAWPPLTVSADDRLAGSTKAMTDKLKTIKRDDGKLQVTYNGAPVYFFKDDKAPGDAKGDKVGNVWAVVKP
jgi:predicted lipoprotein with Yx(FWY)xxD motif